MQLETVRVVKVKNKCSWESAQWKCSLNLLLVSSLAISANAMAMQSMDDAALSAATGQDGINIGIALGSGGITIDKLYLHDNDGLATSTGITGASGTAGAIAISGVTVTQKVQAIF